MSSAPDRSAMRRVLVLGGSGSGKTTFTNRLAEITGLPKIHLDQEYFQPDWVPVEESAWQVHVAALAERPEWIIDGTFGDTLPVRIAAADTVFFFQIPRWISLCRVLRRTITHHGQVREDFAPGCLERFDWQFLKFVWNYRRDKEPQIFKALEGFDGHYLRFERNSDAERFLAAL